MKNTHSEKGGKQGPQAPVTKLPRMEMYAVLGLELSQKILGKLEKIEESLEILARQKARELNPDEPDAAEER